MSNTRFLLEEVKTLLRNDGSEKETSTHDIDLYPRAHHRTSDSKRKVTGKSRASQTRSVRFSAANLEQHG